MKISNKEGQRFTRLLVLKKSKSKYQGRTIWVCKCDCGVVKEIVGAHLMSGATQSCGCLQREINRRKKPRERKQLMYGTRPYRIWAKMKARCNNKNETNYNLYGARGIRVCKYWNEFDNFWLDMKNGYNDSLSIDRINNNGNYYKENCKWSTSKEQSQNRRMRTDGRFTKKYL